MFGKLNVKGKEVDISFPFSALPQENGYRFQGQFKVNRRDLGVGGSSVTMSDEVTVLLDVYTQRKQIQGIS
jgi:polyisoprenoid-binding protein YceI